MEQEPKGSEPTVFEQKCKCGEHNADFVLVNESLNGISTRRCKECRNRLVEIWTRNGFQFTVEKFKPKTNE